jgi:ribosomal-protein-alanine N-acetyltransferase
MQLVTKRFFVRSLKTEDVQALAKLWTDPDVTRFMGSPRDYEEVYEQLMEDAHLLPPPKFDLWVVIEKATRDIIGHCGILDKDIDNNREFELVYVIDKPSWGKGYATEIATAIRNFAFHELGLNRIVSLIDPANQASSRVAIKVGLKYEKAVVRPGDKIMHLYSLEKAQGLLL